MVRSPWMASWRSPSLQYVPVCTSSFSIGLCPDLYHGPRPAFHNCTHVSRTIHLELELNMFRPFLTGYFFFEVTSRGFYAFKLVIAPQREEIEPVLLGMSLNSSRRGTQISFPLLENRSGENFGQLVFQLCSQKTDSWSKWWLCLIFFFFLARKLKMS